jgi:two-component system nitrate/nitrite sensor histidine kinase NarX
MIASELATPTRRSEDDLLIQLEAAVQEFEETAGIPVEVMGAGPFLDRMTSLAQKQLLMIIGEALANIQRHAGADHVVIRFRAEAEEDRVYVSIEDDGQGFQPEMVQGNHHLGLHIMRRRAERIGGTLQIDSAVGAGTQVTGSFPMGREDLG